MSQPPCRGCGGAGEAALRASTKCSCALAHLSPNLLVAIANALALVRLRRSHLANLCGRLPDDLLVRSLDDDLRRDRHLEGDARPRRDRHGVRVAHGQLEVVALERGPV